MRSEGLSFYILGVWGWSRVRLTALLCPQPFAHGRRDCKVAVSMWEAAKTCLFQGVRRCVHVVLLAGVPLCDIRRVSGGMCVRDHHEGKVHSTFFTLHTWHSTPFHFPLSIVHWYKTLFQNLISQRCFTCRHSGSLVSLVLCKALHPLCRWTRKSNC